MKSLPDKNSSRVARRFTRGYSKVTATRSHGHRTRVALRDLARPVPHAAIEHVVGISSGRDSQSSWHDPKLAVPSVSVKIKTPDPLSDPTP